MRLNPSSRRAGPRSLLALRQVRFSAHKKICDEPGEMFAGSYGTSNEPRPTCLAGSVCLFVCLFVFCFFITASYLLYRERRNARAEVLILTAHSQAFANQSIRGRTKLKSRFNYPCFQVSNRGDYFQFT